VEKKYIIIIIIIIIIVIIIVLVVINNYKNMKNVWEVKYDPAEDVHADPSMVVLGQANPAGHGVQVKALAVKRIRLAIIKIMTNLSCKNPRCSNCWRDH
jgi:vancomycin permeability regulator SanA